MSLRTASNINDVFAVMHALSSAHDGMTIGEIEKSASWMSRGQVERVLSGLSEIGFTYHEVKPHGRTGKRVFRLTEAAVMSCSSIAYNYTSKN